MIGAGHWERTVDRTAQGNGSRPRTLTTSTGDLELRIPKLADPEAGGRVDRALFAVIMDVYRHGASTRKVDHSVKALGADTGSEGREPCRLWGSSRGSLAFSKRTLGPSGRRCRGARQPGRPQ